MDQRTDELVRIDATGTAHAVGRTASQRMRGRQGAFRLMPAPAHLVVMRFVGEDGQRDAEDGAIMRLSGEITAPGVLCDIVSFVGQAAWRGELAVLDGETSRSIFFEQGHVVSAVSNVAEERIGQVLYRYGALTEAQVEEVAAAVTPELRFGQTATALGLITAERLFQIVTAQIEEIVYAVLRAGDGMFYFLDGFDESRLPSRLHVSVGSLLMEGVRRMDEMRYFRERIPSDQHVPARIDGKERPEDPLGITYDAIDGARSIEAIGRAVGRGEFEITQAIFQLVQSGHVALHAPRATGPEAIVALFNQAITMLLSELDERGQGDKAREQLASFATGAGVYDTLFRGGGPLADGSLDAARIASNILVLAGAEQAESMLSQWLYEYVSFALFVAEPYFRSDAHGGETPVAVRITELMAPLSP